MAFPRALLIMFFPKLLIALIPIPYLMTNQVRDDTQYFRHAIDSLARNGGTFVIHPRLHPYRLVGKITIPNNVTMSFGNGATIEMRINDTLDINGPLRAGRHKIFEGEGFIRFGPNSVDEVYPDWWGIVYADSSVDNSVSIQKAINSINAYGKNGKIISVGSGEIYVRNTINFPSGVVLKGQGASNVYGGTQVIGTAMTGQPVLRFDERRHTRWFHHGGIENILIRAADTSARPSAGILISQTGENAILRNIAIYECINGIVLGDPTKQPPSNQNYYYQVSATLQNLSLHRNSGTALLIHKSIGLVNVTVLSGDENGNMIRIDSGSTSLSVTINGLKSETIRPMEHDPAILLTNSDCVLTVLGGWVTAYGGASDFIRIVGKQERPRIVLLGVGYRDYPVLIRDQIRQKVISTISIPGGVPTYLDPVFYNTSPTVYLGR